MEGKGSGRRPTQIDDATFQKNWERVFGGKKKTPTLRERMEELTLRECMEAGYDELMFADGFDDCILGICERMGQDPIVAYDYEKILDRLMAQGMDYMDAVEHFNFNIIGAWVGDLTPCFITRYA